MESLAEINNNVRFEPSPSPSRSSQSDDSLNIYDDVENEKKCLEDIEEYSQPNIHFGTSYYVNDLEDQTDNHDVDIHPPSEPDSIPKYDAFTTEIIERTNTGENKCYDIAKQITKAVAYIFIFLLVLSAAILAKGCLLFMTSQLRAEKTTPYCYDSDHLQSYQAVTNLAERSQWIWAIFFVFMVPEVWTVIRCVLLVTFKSFERPPFKVFFIVFIFEALHTVGVALLVFVALPEMDVIKGAMLTNCTCIVPAILMLVSRIVQGDAAEYYEQSRYDQSRVLGENSADSQKKWWTQKRIICVVIDFIAIVSQLSGLIAWPLADRNKLHYATWAIPAGIFLTSFGWWENYLDIKFKISKRRLDKGRVKERDDENFVLRFLRQLHAVKANMSRKRTRAFAYVFIPILKMAVFLGSMVGFVCMTSGEKGRDRFFIFKYFLSGKISRTIAVETTNVSTRLYESPHLDGSMSIFVVDPTQSTSTTTEADSMAAILTFVIQAIAAYVCYIIGKYACKVKVQSFSYAVPITFAVPLTIAILMTFCGMKGQDVCFAEYVIPRYLYWVCPPEDVFTTFLANEYAWVWIFWFISQTWITVHIWAPKCDRLAPTELLYVTPMYSSILTDQSLSLNRRRDDGQEIKMDTSTAADEERAFMDNQSVTSLDRELLRPAKEDSIPKVIACITMWHETENEMLQTLKSVMRMDVDHLFRRLAQEYTGYVSKDYYIFEANIFMDNAFDYKDNNVNHPIINEYVERLIQLMNEAARKIYDNLDQNNQSLHRKWIGSPNIYSTPFGGRMIFDLPGGTKLTVHLKDKQKIRIRKRWSQVMYMYYLLGYRLWNLNLEQERLAIKAENTFILALDGDIEFKPEAVHLLVDLMKKNSNLGAACGRIHPVGSGFMAWYQRFEYAIGHWLQKATEHVIGCVLCAPGCFSLFRAQALMEPNVMRTYTTKPTKPRHYVQYEQGEDRWLCTLLLQRGFRVEYAAASDAYTHCPEAFSEFFTQRRRWVPSTMANIIDLLQTSRDTIKNNDDISVLYIFYQWVLMVSSILGPGTIFLMLVGSIVAAFGIDIHTAFWINLVPVLLFLLVAMFTKQKYQIMLAELLTCIYALLMMAVIVGILLEANVHGWLSPSSFFLLVTAGLMIITAILHPMEIFCIVCGIVYWVVIPSMYLLLIVYSIMNMNDVTWGVRENPASAAAQAEAEAAAAETKKKNKGQQLISNLLGNKKNSDEDAGCTLGCANLFSCQVCTHPKPENDLQKVMNKLDSHLDVVMEAVKGSQWNKLQKNPFSFRRRSSHLLRNRPSIIHEEEEGQEEEFESNEDPENTSDDEMSDRSSSSSDDGTISWMKADCLCDAKTKELDDDEVRFWNYMLMKYLHPIDENREEQKKMRGKLKNLRNQSAFAFFMLNALFVVTVLLMQLHQDTLFIEYPDFGNVNISCTRSTAGEQDIEWSVSVAQNMLRLEPIGFVFLIMYAAILILQFIAMLFHRFGTITLILATTSIGSIEKDNNERHYEEAITIIIDKAKRHNPRPDSQSSDEEIPLTRPISVRRLTIWNLQQSNLRDNMAQRQSETVNLENIVDRKMSEITSQPRFISDLRRRATKSVAHKIESNIRRKSTFRMSVVVPSDSSVSTRDSQIIHGHQQDDSTI